MTMSGVLFVVVFCCFCGEICVGTVVFSPFLKIVWGRT